MSNTSLLGAYGDNSGSSLMFKNRIINGGMQVNQRYAFSTEVIFSTNTGPYFFTDRWFGSQTGNGIGDEILLQSMSLGAGELVGRHHCVRIRQYKATGFDGGTSRYATILDPSSIEDLRGQTVTLSFYHRSPVAFSAYSTDWKVFVNYDTDNATITSGSASTVSFDARGTNIIQPTFRTTAQGTSDNWVRSSYSFTIPSNAERLSICFVAFNNTTNNAALDLTNVQLEAGPVATPFEKRPYAIELDMCERYYENNRQYDSLGGYLPAYPVLNYSGTGIPQGEPITVVNFRKVKRRIPTFTVYSAVTGAPNIIRTPGIENAVNYTGNYPGPNITPYFASVFNNTGANFPVVTRMHFNYDADAEL